MNNKRATKRALLTSAMALVMCVVMLAGTTFAWFTDTASTGVNKIQAGNLDVALEMAVGKTDRGEIIWDNAEGKTLQFKKAVGAPADEAVLWEPGCRYELPALRVVNKGNLALKYKIQVTGINGDAKLNEVIDWTIDGAPISLTEQHLAAKTEGATFTIKGHMQETAGNEYQGLSIDGISITVYATQDTVEHDSFGPDYDANARYYSDEPAVVDSGSATFTGNIAGDGAWGVIQAKNGAQVSINANVSAEESEDHYAMAVYATGLGTKVTISGGNFTQEINGTDNQYDLIYASGGAKIVITGGTFKIGGGDPKWTLNCKDNSGSTITVMGGSFYKFDPSAPRANQADEVIVPDTCKVIKSGDWYTVVPKTVSDQNELNSAINNATGAVGVQLPAGTYKLPSLENKDITVVGTKDTVIDMKGEINKASSASFEGVTVEFGKENYMGFQHTGKLTYKDCTINGLQFLYADDVEFINCEFAQKNDDSYHIWTYGAKNVTFTDCKFHSTSNSKSILCYIEAAGDTFTRTFNRCEFVATGTAEKSAIMINPTAKTGTNTYIVNINDCTATGYGENGISGQTIVGVKETVKDNITVNINGTTVYTHHAS